MIAMRWADIEHATDLYRRGALPLKALAWAVARFRAQEDAEVSAADLMSIAGASKSAAYRAIAELRLALAAPPERIGDSRSPGFPDSRKAGKSVPETGNPPTPPYKETEKEVIDTGDAEFPTCGNGLSEGFRRAVGVLGENLQTEPLSGYLSRNAHLPELRALADDDGDGRYPPGWRLESAALKFLTPGIPDNVRSCRNLRGTLGYFLAVARGLRSPYAPPSLAATGTDDPAPPPPRRPTHARPDFRSMTFDDVEG